MDPMGDPKKSGIFFCGNASGSSLNPRMLAFFQRMNSTPVASAINPNGGNSEQLGDHKAF